MFHPDYERPSTGPHEFIGVETEGQPIPMGSCVIGIRYDKGVLIAADTAVSEASVPRYQDVDRVYKINKQIIMGGGGNFHDVQMYRRTIERQVISDRIYQDAFEMKAKALACWLRNTLCARRMAMEPTNVALIVGGMQPNEGPYLSLIDSAESISDDYVAATGPSRQLVISMVRDKKPQERDFTETEALGMIRTCMGKLQCRDPCAITQYTVGVCNANECHIEGPYKVNEDWTLARRKKGEQATKNIISNSSTI
ncbi:proteasome subunit beta type-4-like [Drosophila obscura]|uniref:proteasome subunit beta type-4-like n=1 Tax=Drosophila obscura TaxID=7282 RepID=UPI000BA10074|nr:proteasome subunit beta type-4-like [Drosophila obscura]